MLETKENSPAQFVILLSKIIIPAVCLAIYLSTSVLNGNKFLPWNWAPIGVYVYTTLNLLTLLISASILSSFKVFDVDSWLVTSTNIKAYEEMTKFDAVLTHYTNVATVGLFIGVLIYSGQYFAEEYPKLIAVAATLIIFLVFSLYAILFSRLALRFAKEKSAPLFYYFALTLAVFFVDSVAFKMFIDAVPKLSQ